MPGRILHCSVALGLLVGAEPAVTQDSQALLGQLRRCAMLTDGAQRLACYDGVLVPAPAVIEQPPPAAAAEQPETASPPVLPEPEPEPEPVQAQPAEILETEPAAEEPEPVAVAEVEPNTAPAPVAEAPPPPAPASQPPPAPAAVEPDAAAAADSRFGLKAPEPEPDEAIVVRVVAVREDLTKKLIYRTEDGQVWQQTDKRRARYREFPFEARIRRASMGTYFLQPVSGGAAVRVKRTR